jgi:hypothetical protein
MDSHNIHGETLTGYPGGGFAQICGGSGWFLEGYFHFKNICFS